MIDIHHLDGKRFAIVLTDFSGTGEPETYLVHGTAKVVEGKLYVDRGTTIDFPIPEDTYSRIKPVPSELAPTFDDAVYFTMLSVGPKPDDGVEYKATGMRLPGSPKA